MRATRTLLFLRIRPPPRSTLFPYTTHFRSKSRSWRRSFSPRARTVSPISPENSEVPRYTFPSGPPSRRTSCEGRAMALRSEEHTSELQSHSDLVCRLLLEKKNLAQYEVVLA